MILFCARLPLSLYAWAAFIRDASVSALSFDAAIITLKYRRLFRAEFAAFRTNVRRRIFDENIRRRKWVIFIMIDTAILLLLDSHPPPTSSDAAVCLAYRAWSHVFSRSLFPCFAEVFLLASVVGELQFRLILDFSTGFRLKLLVWIVCNGRKLWFIVLFYLPSLFSTIYVSFYRVHTKNLNAVLSGFIRNIGVNAKWY